MKKERFKVPVTVYLLLQKGDQVLLSRRFNTGWMDGHYSTVSGHIEGNESISTAMIREAKEETGITIQKEDLIPAYALHRYAPDREYVSFFFACITWEGEPKNMEPEKCDDLSWFPLNNLPDNVLPYIKEAIEGYQKGIAFSEHGWQ